MIRVGIVGSAGYTAGELFRILLQHPAVRIECAYSTSSAGKLISDVHHDLIGDSDLRFSDVIDAELDVVFLCVDHGQASTFLREHPWLRETKIIDLSNEYRLADPSHDFVYGLPELQRDVIRNASRVANPGCFATAIQLGLLPFAAAGMIGGDIVCNATTGSTGAGRKKEDSLQHSWRAENLQVYKAFQHQHIPEIMQSLGSVNTTNLPRLHFIPQRGSFTRGIHATSVFRSDASVTELQAAMDRYFDGHPFTQRVEEMPDMKRVVNTNKALVHVTKHEDMVLVVSVIDNLLKGASGQAVQNMNLMFDLDESTALRLKAVAF